MLRGRRKKTHKQQTNRDVSGRPRDHSESPPPPRPDFLNHCAHARARRHVRTLARTPAARRRRRIPAPSWREGQVLQQPLFRTRAHSRHVRARTHTYKHARGQPLTRSADRSISSRLRAGESLAISLLSVFAGLKMEASSTTIDRELRGRRTLAPSTQVNPPPAPNADGSFRSERTRRDARPSRCYILLLHQEPVTPEHLTPEHLNPEPGRYRTEGWEGGRRRRRRANREGARRPVEDTLCPAR